MKSVDYWQNGDGTWTARIFDQTFTAKTRGEVLAWLRNNGEQP